MPPPASQIFLSYSRNDLDAANALRASLEHAGFEVFKDDDAIRSGERWLTRLQAAVAGCTAFVVLVGRDGVRRWMGAEAEVALVRHLSPHDDGERLAIFPLLLDDTAPEALPPFLALFQATRWSAAEALPTGWIDDLRTGVSQVMAPEPFEGCPFLGLSAFGRKHARLFFGRRTETLQALACLGDQREGNPEDLALSAGGHYRRWLQIEGSSGAGKSSLVQAGMLPMIEQGALWPRTGLDQWVILGPMMPGSDPLAKLAEVLEHGLEPEGGRRDSLARLKQLEQDARALAFALRDRRVEGGAFLLIIDQFEELFTLADEGSRKRFDALLAGALQDAECPLFVISTVRADFLDRFELLPRMQAIYNSHCSRYLLPGISEDGLREIIEEPARLAGLDVSEVRTSLLEDARDELGALPLVENALFVLWSERDKEKLSGDYFSRVGGIAGMLSSQADALLARIADELGGKGRKGALELMLRLTRIHDEGRHARQRISRGEAVMVAGAGNEKLGERVVQMLAGERLAEAGSTRRNSVLRLVTINTEQATNYVDLIHETLIRARGKDAQTGKPVGYWPTLFEYIDRHRDRDLHRQQLGYQAARWQGSGALGRWRNLAGWRDLARYGRLPVDPHGFEARFLRSSRWAAWVERALLLVVLAYVGALLEGLWWADENKLPPSYALQKPFWWLGYGPVPEMVAITPGRFTMGCKPGRDDVEGAACGDEDQAHEVTLTHAYALGKYEVRFVEYDYYVWDRKRSGKGKELEYPPDERWGRGDRPVINVSWEDARRYAAWLTGKLDLTGSEVMRLPTEAEWEYAARANVEEAYWWGPNFDPEKAVCSVEGSTRSVRNGALRANPWGLHDMLGNVWEWVTDRYAPYPNQAAADPIGPGSGRSRVLRGGAWDLNPQFCRAALRFDYWPDSRFLNLGFRVCRGSPIDPQATAPRDTETPNR